MDLGGYQLALASALADIFPGRHSPARIAPVCCEDATLRPVVGAVAREGVFSRRCSILYRLASSDCPDLRQLSRGGSTRNATYQFMKKISPQSKLGFRAAPQTVLINYAVVVRESKGESLEIIHQRARADLIEVGAVRPLSRTERKTS
jgi:hypothetical protein